MSHKIRVIIYVQTFEVPNRQYMNGPIKAENSPKDVGNLAICAYARPCGITVIPTAKPAIKSLIAFVPLY